MFTPEPALSPAPARPVPPLCEVSSRPSAPAGASALRLTGLDALRGIAALCVVVMHVGAIYPGAPRLVGAAYLAVDFFFLLSGFVMARTYEARMHAGTLPAWRFLRARYLRLWPTMAVGAVLSAPFLWRDNPDLPVFLRTALPNLLLLPAFAIPVLFGLNTPAWSVFFELVANVGHATVLRRLGNQGLALVVLVFFVAAAACGVHFGNLDLGSKAENIVGGLARVGLSYGLGVLLWRWHGDRAPLPVPPWLAFLAMPALFWTASRAQAEGWLFDLGFIALACPLLLWGGLALREGGPRSLQALCLAFGAISFPLYAVHYPVLLAVEAAGLDIWLAPVAALAAAALLTRTMAALGGSSRGVLRSLR